MIHLKMSLIAAITEQEPIVAQGLHRDFNLFAALPEQTILADPNSPIAVETGIGGKFLRRETHRICASTGKAQVERKCALF